MAFDVYGIQERHERYSANEFCLRFNIWKWNDLRLLLHEFKVFEHIDEDSFMSNDGYEIVDARGEVLFEALRSIKSKEQIFRNSGISWISHVLTNKDRPYALGCTYSPMDQFGLPDIALFDILMSKFSGIRIK